MSEQTYSDEQIKNFLSNGGRLFRANGQLFIVEQTGLIIGPITVEKAAFFVTRNSTKENIYMSGENFKNKMMVEALTQGLSVSNVQITSRGTVTFDIACDDSGVAKGGHSLQYSTREAFDGSSVTIQNNIVVMPKAPQINTVDLGSRTTGFMEIGAGADESEHSDGHAFNINGAEFYDLVDVEEALVGDADFSAVNLLDADGAAVVAAAKPLVLRIGQYDAAAGTWTDDDDFTQVGLSVDSEGLVSVTIEIAQDKEIDHGTDSITRDIAIETYSGDLGDLHSASNFMRAQNSGSAAILEDAITIRRARPEQAMEVYKIPSTTSVTAANFESLKTAAGTVLVAQDNGAGECVPETGLAQADALKQQDACQLLIKVQSAHLNKACLDSSARMTQVASVTLPADGKMHESGGASQDFTTSGAGTQALTVLDEEHLLVNLAPTDSQPIGSYSFGILTESSESATQICTLTLDIDAGVFEFTVLDITLTTPNFVYAQSGKFAMEMDGDGLPAGYQNSIAAGETQVPEGSVAITAIATDAGNNFALQVDDINVQSDDEMSFSLEHQASALIAAMAADAAFTAEHSLGNYDVQISVTDAEGSIQQASKSIQVISAWPPVLVDIGGTDQANYVRENSLGKAWADDICEARFARLRGDLTGSGQAGSLPAINGVTPAADGKDVELKIVFNAGDDVSPNYQDVSTCYKFAKDTGLLVQPDEDELVQDDDADVNKPVLLIKDLVVEKESSYGTQADGDGVDHEVYCWKLDIRVVSEERMMNTTYLANGNDTFPEGTKLSLAVRRFDRSVDGQPGDEEYSEWAYFDNFLEILPDNIEVDALAVGYNQAHELARASAESASASGDNFYPSGEGEGGPSASGSGADSGGGGQQQAFGARQMTLDSPGADQVTITLPEGGAQQVIDTFTNDPMLSGLQIRAAGVSGELSVYVSKMDLSVGANGLVLAAGVFNPGTRGDWEALEGNVDAFYS